MKKIVVNCQENNESMKKQRIFMKKWIGDAKTNWNGKRNIAANNKINHKNICNIKEKVDILGGKMIVPH